jgi:hypothetical protein
MRLGDAQEPCERERECRNVDPFLADVRTWLARRPIPIRGPVGVRLPNAFDARVIIDRAELVRATEAAEPSADGGRPRELNRQHSWLPREAAHSKSVCMGVRGTWGGQGPTSVPHPTS